MSDVRIDPSGVRLLVVDADRAQGDELAAALSEVGYARVLVSVDAGEAAERGITTPPDLVLVDLDALGTTETVAALRTATTVPPGLAVLGLTADATPTGRRRAASVGVHDFLIRPLEGAELRLRVDNALASGRLRRLLSDRSARLTEALRERTSELSTIGESLSVIAAMADYHDDDTEGHAQRVGAVAVAIGRALDLSDSFVGMLRLAAPLHDIGKVGISRRILLKPGTLSPPEWLHMMRHVEIGAQILASTRSPVLLLAAEVARTHHERWDGSGYTAGLAGEEIPLPGRIVAVADVWDTLTHTRPYRVAWEPQRALEEVNAQAGSQFDPRVVAAFSSLDLQSLELPGDSEERAA